MKLILHIGTEKTGTTSIQKYLSVNRELFLQNGYYVPLNMGHDNHRKIPSYCMRKQRFDNFHKDNGIFTIEDKLLFKDEINNDVRNEFSNLPNHIHTVIISSEHLHSRLKYQDEVNSVKELLSPYFDEFQIIVYLRKQIDMATSLYSTAIKGGSTETNVNQFINNMCRVNNHYCNFYTFLSMWENTFGNESMMVCLFDRKSFYDKDLLKDFTHRISANLLDTIQNNLELPEKVNESLRVFGQDALCILNSNKDKMSKQQYIQMRRTIVEECSGKGKLPDYETAESVMMNFLESNRKVQEKYFPNRRFLFDESLEKFNKIHGVTSESELKVFEGIIKLLNVSITKKDIDTIRDIAISLEKTDLQKAKELMEIAYRLRPEGIFIKNKLEQYTATLLGSVNEYRK